MKRGRKYIVKDVPIETHNSPLRIYDLRRLCGWWKRYSLFSVDGVKEILVYTVLFLSS